MLLKDYLYENGITQTEFARKLVIDRSQFCIYVNGYRRFSPNHAIKIHKLTKGKVTRDEALFPEFYKKAKS